MSPGEFVFLLFVAAIVLLVGGEIVFAWVVDRIVRPDIDSVLTPKEDAEARLGRWHRGWRVWTLRAATPAVILVVLWTLIPQPKPRTSPAELLNRAVDEGERLVERQLPAGDARSEKIKRGLREAVTRGRGRNAPGQP